MSPYHKKSPSGGYPSACILGFQDSVAKLCFAESQLSCEPNARHQHETSIVGLGKMFLERKFRSCRLRERRWPCSTNFPGGVKAILMRTQGDSWERCTRMSPEKLSISSVLLHECEFGTSAPFLFFRALTSAREPSKGHQRNSQGHLARRSHKESSQRDLTRRTHKEIQRNQKNSACRNRRVNHP